MKDSGARRSPHVSGMAIATALAIATPSCKTWNDTDAESRTKAAAIAAPPQGPAFDVNDLSILFPRQVNTSPGGFQNLGMPYPNIALDKASLGKLGIGEIWPQKDAFERMLAFAQGEDFGPTPAATQLAVRDPGMPRAQYGVATPVGGSVLALDDNFGVSFEKRTISTFLDAHGQETTEAGVNVSLKGRSALVLDQSNWHVVSLRVDPCAEQGADECHVEFRLIAQPLPPVDADPLGASKNERNVSDPDITAHLLFNFGKLDIHSGRILQENRKLGLPEAITFAALVADMQAIKALVKKQGAASDTDGKPLGIHPGLSSELVAGGGQTNGPVAQKILELIKKYTAGGLSVVTTMAFDSAMVRWFFFQGAIIDGKWEPVGITGGSPQMSIRFDENNDNLAVFRQPPKLAPGFVSTHPLFLDLNLGTRNADPSIPFRVDNPGRYGGHEPRQSVQNTDCISCHTTARLTQNAVNHDEIYVPAPGITGYPGRGTNQGVHNGDQPAITHDNSTFINLRNFGYHENEAFVMSRTVNEAAEAARFINEDILNLQNPGFVCKKDASDTERKKNHQKLWDCILGDMKLFEVCATEVCKNQS